MTPDDPRHGTEAGHMAHRRAGQQPCEACMRARMRGQKKRRMRGGAKVAALGSQRRIQALQTIGWSRLRIAREIGYTDNGALTYLMQSDTMLASTAAKITEVYDRLSMQIPTGPGVQRAKTWAARFDYLPPLAWDDIDDPNEQPRDWRYTTTGRADMIRDLAEQGAGVSEACRRLNLSRKTLQKWCGNNGMSDVYRQLVAREVFAPNGVMEEGAA